MKNVIEIKNSEVRIHINKTKLKWKYLNGREIKKISASGKDRRQGNYENEAKRK